MVDGVITSGMEIQGYYNKLMDVRAKMMGVLITQVRAETKLL